MQCKKRQLKANSPSVCYFSVELHLKAFMLSLPPLSRQTSVP